MTHGRSGRSLRARAGGGLRFAVPLALMCGILVSSHRPLPTSIPGDWDKLLHALAYAVLAAAWLYAFAATRIGSARGAVASAGIAMSWGVVDEVHQSFVPGRFASAGDATADAAGAVAASLLLFFVGRRRSAAATRGDSAETL